MRPQPPDFLELPNTSSDATALLRTDLATLREHARRPDGIPDSECLSTAVRDRLLAARLLEWRPETSYRRTHITSFGAETVRMNASCRDGSEGPLG